MEEYSIRVNFFNFDQVALLSQIFWLFVWLDRSVSGWMGALRMLDC